MPRRGAGGSMTTTAATRATSTAAKTEPTAPEFTTVFGRELVAELPNFVHRPYLVVTMADLWPRFEASFDEHLAGVHFVTTLDAAEVEAQAEALPEFGSVVGLGGGQASDVAKFFAWRRGRPI